MALTDEQVAKIVADYNEKVHQQFLSTLYPTTAHTNINNYIYDYSGQYGPTARIPQITNVPNMFMISGHGYGDNKGMIFPMKTDTNFKTNDFANGVPIEDAIHQLGPATNNITKAIIDSCYGAGMSFQDMQKLLPNLQELIKPSETNSIASARIYNLAGQATPAFDINTNEPPYYKYTTANTNPITTLDWIKQNK